MVLSQEEFVKRVIDSFEDIRRDITNLCNKHAELEKKIEVHLKVEEELDNYKKEQLNRLATRKDRRVYLVIALMGAGFAAYQTFEKLILP